ncbi:MAG: response regulator [Desulfobacteraceae bacterium]|jgi:PAS domain S-box-containing protein
MKRKSLNTKLLLIITTAFLLLCIGITLLTDYYFVKIIDRTQTQLYAKEVKEIIEQLEHTYLELQDTLMVENYEDQFKNLILDTLRHHYYATPEIEAFPFIVDSAGMVVLHPRLERGFEFEGPPEFLSRITALKKGNFDYTYNGIKSWVIFDYFGKWHWIVCFTLPFNLKYADARNFLEVLVLITAATTISILLLVSIAVTHFIRPITFLTSAATEMAQGNLELQIENTRQDEVGILTQSFIQMRNSIKEKIDFLNEKNVDLQNEIKERRRAEAELKESERKYRTLFEKSTDAIFVVQRGKGGLLDANQAAVRLSGRTLAQLKGLTLSDVTQWEDGDRFNIAASSGKTEELGKATFLRTDRTPRTAILTVVPLDAEAIIVIARDITDALAMEEHLRQVQKLEAIGTLAGGIAHDFNNILSAILGYAELAMMDLPAEEPLRMKLEAIHSSGIRARNLVAQVLTFSRKDDQVKAPINLETLVEDALKLLRPAIPSTIEIRQQINARGSILGDPSRISQIIMNLCTNAYQAMEESGGVLGISLSEVQQRNKADAPGPIAAGRYAKLTISDTGAGIASEHLERIFDPYFTTKPKGKGTGLGLAVVHGIVNSHGGTVRVESRIGKGTRFDLYFPLTAASLDIKKADGYPSTGGNERILLVDDEPEILEMEKEMLNKMGYTVTTMGDPAEALKLFGEQPTGYDLVITDMTMPKITGDKLACELMRMRPDIPVILCTGFSELTSPEKAASMGIKGYLTKPVSMRQLSKMIRKLLTDKGC